MKEVINKEEVQRNLTHTYYAKILDEVSKQKSPLASCIKETSDYVWGKNIRCHLAHIENDKMIDENIDVELSNIYIDVTVPKNLIDYNNFCERVGGLVANEIDKRYMLGFRAYDEFFGIEYALDNTKWFYNVEKNEFRESKKIYMPKSILLTLESFMSFLYESIHYNLEDNYPDHLICGQKMLPLFESMFANAPNLFYNVNNKWFLDFNYGEVPPICVSFLRNQQNNCIRLLNSSTFTLHQLCDWCWLTNESGEIFKEKDKYNYSATLVKYCNLICSDPQLNATIIIKDE